MKNILPFIVYRLVVGFLLGLVISLYVFLYVIINLYSPRNGSNTKTAIQDYKHKYKLNEGSDQVHHK